MNVSLTRELEAMIHRKVDSGLYGSSSEVVREALRLLKERDQADEERLTDIRRKVDAGVRDLDAGRTRTFDRRLAEKIKSDGRKKLSGRRRRLAS